MVPGDAGNGQAVFKYDWKTPAFFVYKALFVLLAFLLVHGVVTLVQKVRAGTALPGAGWPGRCRTWP